MKAQAGVAAGILIVVVLAVGILHFSGGSFSGFQTQENTKQYLPQSPLEISLLHPDYPDVILPDNTNIYKPNIDPVDIFYYPNAILPKDNPGPIESRCQICPDETTCPGEIFLPREKGGCAKCAVKCIRSAARGGLGLSQELKYKTEDSPVKSEKPPTAAPPKIVAPPQNTDWEKIQKLADAVKSAESELHKAEAELDANFRLYENLIQKENPEHLLPPTEEEKKLVFDGLILIEKVDEAREKFRAAQAAYGAHAGPYSEGEKPQSAASGRIISGSQPTPIVSVASISPAPTYKATASPSPSSPVKASAASPTPAPTTVSASPSPSPSPTSTAASDSEKYEIKEVPKYTFLKLDQESGDWKAMVTGQSLSEDKTSITVASFDLPAEHYAVAEIESQTEDSMRLKENTIQYFALKEQPENKEQPALVYLTYTTLPFVPESSAAFDLANPKSGTLTSLEGEAKAVIRQLDQDGLLQPMESEKVQELAKTGELFDGFSSQAVIPGGGSKLKENSFTVSFLIKPDPEQYQPLASIMKIKNNDGTVDFGINLNKEGGINVVAQEGKKSVAVKSPTALPTDKQTLVTTTVFPHPLEDGKAIIRMYMDGVPVAQKPFTGKIGETKNPIYLGGDGNVFFKGKMPLFKTFNEPLDELQAKELVGDAIQYSFSSARKSQAEPEQIPAE